MSFGSLMGLGDAVKTTSVITSGAATGASLVSQGVVLQSVPVVGTILGTIAIVGGLLTKLFGARKIAKQLQKQRAQYVKALKVLRDANAEADAAIYATQQKIQTIKAELSKVGLSGIDGLGSWFQRTFTPKKNAENNLKKTVKKYNKEYPELEAELNEKIATLEQMQSELKRLEATVKYGKPLVAGGTIVGVVALLALAGTMLMGPPKTSVEKSK